ncbi:MAG: hypothetical protein HY364_00560 [Candidatus Aenigmarchaeota archaeon]|nr:hypothetical protein [Candidatus Aenigmarchaeota archaeon]
MKEEIDKKRKEEWIESWFMIEVMAVDEKVATEALEKHIEKLGKEAFIYEKLVQEPVKVENPTPRIKEAYSRICEVKLFTKDIESLVRLVMLYGPAAVEILGPKKKAVSMEEMQNISNNIAGVMHQFASAGVGGMVITPTK